MLPSTLVLAGMEERRGGGRPAEMKSTPDAPLWNGIDTGPSHFFLLFFRATEQQRLAWTLEFAADQVQLLHTTNEAALRNTPVPPLFFLVALPAPLSIGSAVRPTALFHTAPRLSLCVFLPFSRAGLCCDAIPSHSRGRWLHGCRHSAVLTTPSEIASAAPGSLGLSFAVSANVVSLASPRLASPRLASPGVGPPR